MGIAPTTITIAFNEVYEELETIIFDFIEEKSERAIDGVILSDDIQFDD